MKMHWKKPLFILTMCVFIFSLGLNIVLSFVLYEQSRVVFVPDGDSLELRDGRRVRLLGLDAPEKGRCMSEEAKVRLTERTLGRHVRLKNTVKDSYGRILANVIIDAPLREWLGYLYARFIKKQPYHPTAFINGLMVEEGLAKYNSAAGPYGGWLKRVHNEAKLGKRGIYSPECKQTIALNPDCTIKGNIRQDRKTYHLVGCDNYDQTTVDLSYGDQWFCSEQEAQTAGFQKASGCR
jgi:micrococcal nuclease